MRALAVAEALGIPTGIWSLAPLPAFLGLVVLMFWLTSTGRYIPKSTHELVLAAANKRGDEWKETALTGREQNKVLMDQNTLLLQANRTSAEFFGTVTAKAGGGPNVAQQEATHT